MPNATTVAPMITGLMRAATAIVIAATTAPSARLLPALLEAQPLRWIGRRSYSLYLWHWPPVALLNYQLIEITWPIRAGLLTVVLLLSWLSYRYVENRFRYRPWGFRKSFAIFILLPLFPIWAIQSTIRIADDLSFPSPRQCGI